VLRKTGWGVVPHGDRVPLPDRLGGLWTASPGRSGASWLCGPRQALETWLALSQPVTLKPRPQLVGPRPDSPCPVWFFFSPTILPTPATWRVPGANQHELAPDLSWAFASTTRQLKRAGLTTGLGCRCMSTPTWAAFELERSRRGGRLVARDQPWHRQLRGSGTLLQRSFRFEAAIGLLLAETNRWTASGPV